MINWLIEIVHCSVFIPLDIDRIITFLIRYMVHELCCCGRMLLRSDYSTSGEYGLIWARSWTRRLILLFFFFLHYKTFFGDIIFRDLILVISWRNFWEESLGRRQESYRLFCFFRRPLAFIVKSQFLRRVDIDRLTWRIPFVWFVVFYSKGFFWLKTLFWLLVGKLSAWRVFNQFQLRV